MSVSLTPLQNIVFFDLGLYNMKKINFDKEIILKEFSFFNINDAIDIKNIDSYIKNEITLPHDIAVSVCGFNSLEKLYYSKNILKTQEFETDHFYYVKDFNAISGDYRLVLNRIDTFGEVYLNGELVLKTDNAFISFEKRVRLLQNNRLIIHILPCVAESLKYETSPTLFACRYNTASLNIRKPAYTFGWDIMPRNVLGGIFDTVKFFSVKKDEIKEIYFYTNSANYAEKIANIEIGVSFVLSQTDLRYYEVEISGRCDGSSFMIKDRLWGNVYKNNINIWDCRFWNVRNMGEANLYDVSVRLVYRDEVIDEAHDKLGVRIVELNRTSVCDEENGSFVFKVNGLNTFILGTNWVPVDACASNCETRRETALELLNSIGCNMVRVWGGGYYETDDFYDYCDEHGILVWQDFMMACGVYPKTNEFIENLSKEVVCTVKRLRNHPCLALWAGDNECDYFFNAHNMHADPNNNILTRDIIPKLLFENDPDRIYLPSSPYYDKEKIKSGKDPSEDHNWGPRDFFKSEYYVNFNTCFTSEIGYMGMPCLKSISRFIDAKEINDFESDDYVVHASCPTVKLPYYKFRIQQNLNPIKEMFGCLPNNINDIVLCSQIGEAEALKYFIEKMRIKKGRTGGIVWWNLLDGWPQLSDSVVDYYFNKKLAYYYIKNCQEYFSVMMDEINGKIVLKAVNDTNKIINFSFKLKDITNDNILCCDTSVIIQNGILELWNKPLDTNRVYYKIEWMIDNIKYSNHYISNIKGVTLHDYLANLSKCGINVRELVEN